MAGGAGRSRRARGGGAGEHAADRAAAAGRAGARSRRGRAPCLPRPEAGRAGDRVLHRLALLPHRHLQGTLRGRPARGLLRRPARPGGRDPLRHLPPALLHEHDAVLGARAALPRALPQRRDQRDSGQRELDACPRGPARVGRRLPVRTRRRPGRLRFRDAGQRPRAARPRRPGRTACADDARPGGVGGQRRARPGRARLLPLPLRSLRAVGRTGGARVHGRARRRRDARPQRPAAAPLRGRRRPRRLRVRGGRHGPPGGAGAPRQARPRRDAGRRSRAGARGGRSAQAPARLPRAVRRVARARARARVLRVARRRAGRRPHRAPGRLRVHAGGPSRDHAPDGGARARADVVDGGRRGAHSSRRPRATAVCASSASASRRSPTRRSTTSASASCSRCARCSAAARRCSSRARRRPAASSCESFFLYPDAFPGLDAERIDITFAPRRGARGGPRPRRRRDGGVRARRPRHAAALGRGRRTRARADSDAARRRRRPRPARRRGAADVRDPRGRERRAARGAPPRVPAGLRRRGDLPAARASDGGSPGRRGQARLGPALAGRGAGPLPPGGRGRCPQGHVQDGHLRRRQLLRRAAVRHRRPCARGRRALLRGHELVRRRPRLRRAGAGSPRAARPCMVGRRAPRKPRLRQVPQGRRAPRDRPRGRRGAPRDGRRARAAQGRSRRGHRALRALRRARQRPRAARAAGPARARADRRGRAARRGRARGVDRAALFQRGHVPRLPVCRGARDGGDRVQPAGRTGELRRGRRGPGPLPRRAQLPDQAGRVGPLRGHARVRRVRRRAADQDRAGLEAR